MPILNQFNLYSNYMDTLGTYNHCTSVLKLYRSGKINVSFTKEFALLFWFIGFNTSLYIENVTPCIWFMLLCPVLLHIENIQMSSDISFIWLCQKTKLSISQLSGRYICSLKFEKPLKHWKSLNSIIFTPD